MVFCLLFRKMLLFLDTETTGLAPGNICQLSYVMQSDSGVIAKNMFFKVDHVPKEAVAIHGFSAEKLKVLSNGLTFKDRIEEIEKDFSQANVIVAHNFSFDYSFLREEFLRQNKVFTYSKSYCSMKSTVPVCKLKRPNSAGFKYPKLSELCEFLGIKDKQILKTAVNLFGSKCGYHDARFDTTAVYLAVNKLIEKNIDNSLKEYLG